MKLFWTNTSSKKVIASATVSFGAMALAPDNKIYLNAYYGSQSDLNKLSIIDQPDNMGAACNFLPQQITLPILQVRDGLAPNYPNYRLSAVPPNYCDSLLQLAVSPPQEEGNLHLYPNPAKDKITLEYSKNYQGGEGDICNLLGEKIFSFGISATENKMQINISKLPSGVYSLHVYNAHTNAREVQKIVIE